MNELKGTEKQINWAKDIKNNIVNEMMNVLETVKDNSYNHIISREYSGVEIIKEETEIRQYISDAEKFKNEFNTLKYLVENIKDECSAELIIQNRENLVIAIAEKHNIKKYRRLLNAYHNSKKHN